MKIAIIDDYQDAFRTLDCYKKLSGHDVIVYNDTEKDPARLAQRLKDAEAVILTQQRSPFPRTVIEQLPNLKLVNQTGRNVGHVDVDACTQHGIIVSAGGSGDPHTTAELTWGLILAALRHIPQEVRQLKEGNWQSTLGTRIKGKTLGIYALGRIAYCAMYNLTQGRYVAPFVILTLQGLTLELKEGNNGRVHHGTTIQAGVFTIHL